MEVSLTVVGCWSSVPCCFEIVLNEIIFCRARRVDFQVGWGRGRLMYNRKREPSGGNMKFKSSEMARNGSKTVNSEVNF